MFASSFITDLPIVDVRTRGAGRGKDAYRHTSSDLWDGQPLHVKCATPRVTCFKIAASGVVLARPYCMA